LNVELLSLDAFPQVPEVEESGASYRENALLKAKATTAVTGEITLADDSGLEVDALGGAPGIYSARYAGSGATDADNNRKLLAALQGVPPEKRGAVYHCALVLYRPDGTYETFLGRWEGKILDRPLGEGGFGYDPVFFLPEQGVAVAQLPAEEKNRQSHRGQALAKLRDWLQQETL
jgi:XTP/dITP diphosphohydrolase